MLISRAELESAISIYRTSRKKKAQAVQSVSYDTDQVAYVCSAEALDFAELAASVSAFPLYREALVDDLGHRIAQGEYDIPAEQIVEILWGRLVLEALPA